MLLCKKNVKKFIAPTLKDKFIAYMSGDKYYRSYSTFGLKLILVCYGVF